MNDVHIDADAAEKWAEAVVLSEAWRAAGLDPDALAAEGVAAARAELDAPSRAVAAVAFADDALLRRLNREHRHVDAPTNVLAFPAAAGSVDAPGEAALGDVVLGFETIAREAAELGISTAARAVHMVVHGYFHLHGYDHHAEDDALEMESMERRALARLGLDDPYRDRDNG